MLILSRREKESIIINDNIEITVVEISEGRVRLGISAPSEMDIYRKELYDKIEEEMKLAASGKDRMESLKRLSMPGKK